MTVREDESATSDRRPTSYLTLEQQEYLEGWLFVSGKLLLILLVLVIPITFGLYVSFTRSNLYQLPGPFVGLDNYVWLLGYDVWWTSLFNVTLMGLVLLPANIFLSLSSALLLSEKLRGRYLYRTAYVIPIAGPPIIWALVWKFLYFPGEAGILNAILLDFGLIGNPIGWLSNLSTALPAVIVSQVWGFGLSMLIYMAGISGIPASVIESSKLDGAGRFDRLRYIVWPLLKPTTFFLVVVQLINVFRLGFGAVFVLTKGGPINATMVPSFLIYSLAFDFNSFGKSAAASFVMFLLTLAITLILWKPLQSRAEYYQ